MSVTRECKEQVRLLVIQSKQDNRSTWFEDLVWREARRKL